MKEIVSVETPAPGVVGTGSEAMYSTIRYMEIGEEKSFPIKSLGTIRSYCSQLGLTDQKKYSTRTDRTTREVIVKRNI